MEDAPEPTVVDIEGLGRLPDLILAFDLDLQGEVAAAEAIGKGLHGPRDPEAEAIDQDEGEHPDHEGEPDIEEEAPPGGQGQIDALLQQAQRAQLLPVHPAVVEVEIGIARNGRKQHQEELAPHAQTVRNGHRQLREGPQGLQFLSIGTGDLGLKFS